MLNQDCSTHEAEQELEARSQTIQGIPLLPLAQRKYDQIMSCTQNDLAEGHSNSAIFCRSSIKRIKAAAGDVEEDRKATSNYNDKRFKHCFLAERSFSPGSNSSDVTTEFMAESSKSSCFEDDHRSGASTSELIHSLRIGPVNHGGAQHKTVEGSGERRDEKSADEDEFESKSLSISRRAAAKAGKSIEYYSSQDSWLQLGLGPSSRLPNVLQAPPAAPAPLPGSVGEVRTPSQAEQVEYFPISEVPDEVDVSRQQKAPLLHLFPSKPETSVQISEYKEFSSLPSSSTHHLGTSTPTVTPPATPASELHLTGTTTTTTSVTEIFYNSNTSTTPRARFRHESSSSATGFMRPVMREFEDTLQPDTQLVISYNGARNKGVGLYAHHQGGDDQPMINLMRQSQSRGVEMLGDHPYPASASFPAGTLVYNTSPYEPLGFQEFGGRPYVPPSTGSSYSWKHETLASAATRPEADYPPSLGSRLSNLPGPIATHAGEDWQSLIKRLGGGNLQFQSLFPSMGKVSANSSSSDVFGVADDMQRRRFLVPDFHPGPTPTVHWTSGPGEAGQGRATGNSWTSHQLFGSTQQEMKPLPFSFQDSGSGFMNSRPSVWQTSTGILPFLPPGFSQHAQQLAPEQHHQQQVFKESHRRIAASSTRSNRQEEQQQSDLWFSLRAGATNQDSERLPQVPKGYLRVKDASVPVSHVKKYLVHKLGLTCESEVEISCRGQVLLSNLSLQHVRDVIWYSSGAGERDETSSSESKNIVMELSYRRPVQFNLTF